MSKIVEVQKEKGHLQRPFQKGLTYISTNRPNMPCMVLKWLASAVPSPASHTPDPGLAISTSIAVPIASLNPKVATFWQWVHDMTVL